MVAGRTVHRYPVGAARFRNYRTCACDGRSATPADRRAWRPLYGFTELVTRFQNDRIRRRFHETSHRYRSRGLYFLPLDTLQPRFVETHCTVPVLPKFNPKQDSIAFSCIDRMDRSSIEVLDVDSGRVDQLLSITGIMKGKGLDWSADGRFLFYSYTDPDGGKFIWEMEAAHPEHRWRLPLAHDASDLAVSRNGNSLAYVQSFLSTNIWKLSLTAQPVAHMLIASTRNQNNPSVSPDGLKIAFESDRGGSHEVWISDADGHNLQQVTHFGSLTGTPSWSPNSKLLAFDSRAEGEANLYVYNVAGGDLRKVIASTRTNSLPSWSRDGRFLFYASGEDLDTPSIWRVPVEGGTATEIIANGDLPISSPDGMHLFFRRVGHGSVSIMRIRLDGPICRQLKSCW